MKAAISDIIWPLNVSCRRSHRDTALLETVNNINIERCAFREIVFNGVLFFIFNRTIVNF